AGRSTSRSPPSCTASSRATSTTEMGHRVLNRVSDLCDFGGSTPGCAQAVRAEPPQLWEAGDSRGKQKPALTSGNARLSTIHSTYYHSPKKSLRRRRGKALS